jgi:hypothetical protein
VTTCEFCDDVLTGLLDECRNPAHGWRRVDADNTYDRALEG